MKKLVTSYTFDASAQTVDSADFTSLDKIQIITNVTDNIIIYNFADAAKGGSLTSTTLTLAHNTTSMADTDNLQIFVDDSLAVATAANLQTDFLTHTELSATRVRVSGTFYQTTQPVSAASLPLPTGAATSANQSTIIGHVDGIETVLGTIDADTEVCLGSGLAGFRSRNT